MTRLGVNIDHIATIRQLRRTSYPDLLKAAEVVEKAGADQLTIHLREDRRHIQDSDVEILKSGCSLPLNLEMAAVDAMTAIACRVKPDIITLVPERREELTTEGGLDVVKHSKSIQRSVRRLHDAGLEVSLFVDPDREQIETSREIDASVIELHTGTYCDAAGGATRQQEFERLKAGARYAASIELRVVAGHGLHRGNLAQLIQGIPEIEEYNIGHSIVARAIFIGLEKAVQEIKTILEGA